MVDGVGLRLLPASRLLRVLLVDDRVHAHGLMVLGTHLAVDAAELVLIRRNLGTLFIDLVVGALLPTHSVGAERRQHLGEDLVQACCRLSKRVIAC